MHPAQRFADTGFLAKLDRMAVSGHQEIYGGDEGLRHHLCLSHGEHFPEGTPRQEMEDFHEEAYHPNGAGHRGEYGCYEHGPEDEPHEWDELSQGIGPIHRGIGVDLPDELHKVVHDRRRRPADRAQALLNHLREDPHGGIGVHWTTDQGVAEDFAERSGRSYATERKPGTAVVFHAAEPQREHIDTAIYSDPTVYGYHDHGEREVPLRHGDHADLTGISWAPMHDDWAHPRDGVYERHDFGHEPREAAYTPASASGYGASRKRGWPKHWTQPPEQRTGRPGEYMYRFQPAEFHDQTMREGIEPRRCAGHLPDDPDKTVYMTSDDHVFHARPEAGHPGTPEWLQAHGDDEFHRHYKIDVSGLPLVEDRTYTNPETGQKRAWMAIEHIGPERIQSHLPGSEHGVTYDMPDGSKREWLPPREASLDQGEELLGHFEAAAPVTASWDASGSEKTGVYLRFGHWPDDERSFSPAGGYHEWGVSAYDLDRHGNPAIDHGLDRGHVHDEECDPEECSLGAEDPDNDPKEEMQGRVHKAEKNRYYGNDKPSETGHLVKGELAGVGYDGEPLLSNVRRVGDWIDHRHLFIPGAQPHRLARDPSGEDYEPPEETPPQHHTAAAEPEHETWYHLTDNPRFALDPEHEPEDNSFSIEDRSGQKGVYLARNPSSWFSEAGEGYARPYLAEVHVHPSVKDAPGVHGRWGGEMFVPAAHFDKLRLHRVIPIDAHAREEYGDHGWIERHHDTEFDTGEPLRQNPRNPYYPFKPEWNDPSAYRYPGPDVRDMTDAEHDRHRDRWLDYLKRDRGFADEDVNYYRQQHDMHRTAGRPSRGERQCPCCLGKGTHGGDSCYACHGEGSVGRSETIEHCPGQPQPKRRHWRQGSMPEPDYDPSEELPTGRGVWYRLHVKGRPLDEAHARSRPFSPPKGMNGDPGLRGYSAFASPHTLSQYMDEFGWHSEGLTHPDHSEVIAFHGKEVGRGDDNEPLVIPEANHSCCGRVIHSRMPFSELEDRIWESAPESIPAKPWDAKNQWHGSPQQKSVSRHYREQTERVNRENRRKGQVPLELPEGWQRMGSHPPAERTESVRHMLDHYRPYDFDTWDEVRDNNVWSHPKMQAFVEDIRRNGVQRPIPVDYEQDPPQVRNGHTRLLAAEIAGIETVPTRQHQGWLDPDDPGNEDEEPEPKEGPGSLQYEIERLRNRPGQGAREAALLGHFEAAGEQIDLYHHTSPEVAAKVYREKRMISKENTGSIFFTTDPESEYAAGFGEGVVHVRMPRAHLDRLTDQGKAWQDDEFPSGEQHWAIHHSGLRPEHFVDPSPGRQVEAVSAEDYGQSHRPDETGPPLHDMTGSGMMPSDFYERMHEYDTYAGAGGIWSEMSYQAQRKMRLFRGKPDKMVTIWRSAPAVNPESRNAKRGEINHGDWVGLSRHKALAESWEVNDPSRGSLHPNDARRYHIWSARVPAHQVRNAGGDLTEWGYFGPDIKDIKHFSEHCSHQPRVTPAQDLPEYQRQKPTEAVMQHHGISGESAPEDGIWAAPAGEGPVAEHWRDLMKHPEKSVVQREGGTFWVHPHVTAPDRGPYYIANDPETAGDGRNMKYHVLDREGMATTPHFYGGPLTSHGGFKGALEDWHTLTTRQDPEGRDDDPSEVHRAYLQHVKASPPQFPHSRVDPHDVEILKRPDARTFKPVGASPSEQWHGPYEVVKHPETGRFHVIDNAGRDATPGWSGTKTQLQAERSRDYIDDERQRKENAAAWAGKMYEGFQQIVDPGSTPESRVSDRNLYHGQALMTRYEGGRGQVRFEDDEDGGRPYYQREHYLAGGQPSGWFVRHYGTPQAHLHHHATGDTAHATIHLPVNPEDKNKMIQRIPDEFGDADLAREVAKWHDAPAGDRGDHERENPAIAAWKRRRQGSLEQRTAAELVEHFEDPQEGRAPFAAQAAREEVTEGEVVAHFEVTAAGNPPCTYCGEPIDDEDVDNGASSHAECEQAAWCEYHQDYHDDPGLADQHNETYTDWSNHLPFEGGIHRGFPVQLPADVHEAVHDEGRPLAERAAILRDHLDENPSEGGGWQRRLTDEEKYGERGHFGVHWTDQPERARAYGADDYYEGHGNGGVKPYLTHVALHAASPEHEHIEDDPDELERRHMYGFDHQRSEREVPLKVGAPVRLTGISWKRGGEEAWHRHDFPAPSEHTAALEAAPEYHPKPQHDWGRLVKMHDEDPENPLRQELHSQWWKEDHDWEAHVRRGLGLGHLDYDQARELGYHGSGHDNPEPTRPGTPYKMTGWQPLPREMYHVTTNMPAVREHGLRSRRELGQAAGQGLGGGEDDTISLTTDRDLAYHMLRSLHEYHSALNDPDSPQKMLEQARTGEGARRPFLRDLMHYYDSKWEDGDPHPEGIRNIIEGRRRHYAMFIGTQQEMAEANGPGWTPADEGWEAPKGHIHGGPWHRAATPEEQLQSRSDLYKNFSAFREHAGGPPDPLYMGNDAAAFAARDPRHFGLVHVRPRPGGHGYPLSGMGEWRTTTGDALEVHRAERLGEGGHPVEASLQATAALANPLTGGHEWFHGTQAPREEFRRGFDDPATMDPEQFETPDGESGGTWSRTLGNHFAAGHDVARAFAEGEHSSSHNDWDSNAEPAVVHARLNLRNPKVYGSEFDLDSDAYEHAWRAGNHPLDHLDGDREDNEEIWPSAVHLHDRYGNGEIPKGVSSGISGIWGVVSSHPDRSVWLNSHPDRHYIAQSFKRHLMDQGHDGIIYGNEIERSAEGHPHANTAAIAFHPHQIEVTRHHDADSPEPELNGHLAIKEAAVPEAPVFYHGTSGSYSLQPGDLLTPGGGPSVMGGRMSHVYYTSHLPTAATYATYGHPLNERGYQDLDAEAVPGHVYAVQPEDKNGRRIGRHAEDPMSGVPGNLQAYRTKGRLRVLYEVDRETGEPLGERTAAIEVVAHFEAPRTAAHPLWMQQKLFHHQPEPSQYHPESGHRTPSDPAWRRHNDPENYEPDECEHCGGDQNFPEDHAEQHHDWLTSQDWYTDWDAEDLPGTLHRGVAVDLPQHVHDVVHDEGRPVHERAQALLHHMLQSPDNRGGNGLGNFWSSDPDVSKTYAESAPRQRALRNVHTPVMLHVHTPSMEHVETDPEELQHWGVYSYHRAGNREVPISNGAPLRVRGISWAPAGHREEARDYYDLDKPGPHHLDQDPAWAHHEFGGEGIRATASGALSSDHADAQALELTAHFAEPTAALEPAGEEMWRHLQEAHGVTQSGSSRTPGADFMAGLHRRFHGGQVASPRLVQHQHEEPGHAIEQPRDDAVSRMFTPIPEAELEERRRAYEPKPERLDDREYSLRDVSRRYDWEGFDSHEIAHLVHDPEHAVFTREDVPVHSLRLGGGNTHSDRLHQPFTYQEIARQDNDEHERLRELERGYDEGANIPPIVVVRDGEHHIIADGSHRAAIHANQGNSHIEAFVTPRTIYPGHTAALEAVATADAPSYVAEPWVPVEEALSPRTAADEDGGATNFYRRDPSRLEKAMEEHWRRQRTGQGWETELVPNRHFVASPANTEGGVTHLLRGYVHGRPAGVIGVGASNNLEAWKVHNVHVHPDFRGQGMEHALMDSLYDHARAHGGRWIDHGLKSHADDHLWQDYEPPHPEMDIHNHHPSAGWNQYFNINRVHREMLANSERFPGTSAAPAWEGSRELRDSGVATRWTMARGMDVDPNKGKGGFWPDNPVNGHQAPVRSGEVAPQRGAWQAPVREPAPGPGDWKDFNLNPTKGRPLAPGTPAAELAARFRDEEQRMMRARAADPDNGRNDFGHVIGSAQPPPALEAPVVAHFMDGEEHEIPPYAGQKLFHGTRSILQPGEMLTPEEAQRHPGHWSDLSTGYVHVTPHGDEAHYWGEHADLGPTHERMLELGRERFPDHSRGENQGHAYRPRVYEVTPTGPMEPDPHGEGQSYRTVHPVRVVRQVEKLECEGCPDNGGKMTEHWPDHPHWEDIKRWQDEEDDDGEEGEWDEEAGDWKPREGTRQVTANSDGDYYVHCDQGHDHWGGNGAAGLLIRHHGDDGQTRYLLQKRSPYVQHGDTWSTPGGALGSHETPEEGARREAEEELGPLPRDVTHSHTVVDDHGGWKYSTVIMDSPRMFEPHGGDEDSDWESEGHRWVTPDQMKGLRLHPGFAASWSRVQKSGALGPAVPSFTWNYETYGPDGGYVPKSQVVSGPFYHGSRSKGLREGDEITTGRKTNGWGDEGPKSQWVHFTDDLGTARTYAASAGGHVYEVEPTGEVQQGYGGGEWKTKAPLRVRRRIAPEASKATMAIDAHVADTVPAVTYAKALPAVREAAWEPQDAAEVERLIEAFPGYFRTLHGALSGLADRIEDEMPVTEYVPPLLRDMAAKCLLASEDVTGLLAPPAGSPEGAWEGSRTPGGPKG